MLFSVAPNPDWLTPGSAPFIDPQFVGVVSGSTGVTLVTERLNLALQMAGAGGEVRLRAGTYTINAPLKVPSNVTFSGAGPGTILRLADGSNCDIITNSDWWRGNERIVIRDLYLDGNRTGQTGGASTIPGQTSDGPGRALISLINAHRCSVVRVHGTSPWTHGIDVGAPDEVDNSLKTLLTGAQTGTFVVGETVTGGTSGATGVVALVDPEFLVIDSVTGTWVSGEVITGSISAATATTSSAALSQSSDTVFLDDCHFRDCGDDGFTTHQSRLVVIRGGSIRDAAATYSGSSNAIEFDDGSESCVAIGVVADNCIHSFMVQGHIGRTAAKCCAFVGCISRNPTTSSFQFSHSTPGTAAYAEGVTVENCISEISAAGGWHVGVTNYRNVRISSGSWRGGATDGLVLSSDDITRTRNVTVEGVQILGCRISVTAANTQEIRIVHNTFSEYIGTTVNIGVPRCRVAGNAIQGSDSGSSGAVGIALTSAATYCTVINNRVRNCKGGGITVQGTGHVILDNVCEGNTTFGIRVLGANPTALIQGNKCFDGGVSLQTYGVQVSNTDSGSSQVRIQRNDLTGNVTRGVQIDGGRGVGVTYQGNMGFVTEAQGQATIGAASTSVTVSHGLNSHPTIPASAGRISIYGSPGSATRAWISSITQSSIVINCDIAPGGTGLLVNWEMSLNA